MDEAAIRAELEAKIRAELEVELRQEKRKATMNQAFGPTLRSANQTANSDSIREDYGPAVEREPWHKTSQEAVAWMIEDGGI
jgi:hypothetical protein